jgi:hypothetical protein
MHVRTCRFLVAFGAVALLFAGVASSASAVTANWTLTVQKNGNGYVSGTGID